VLTKGKLDWLAAPARIVVVEDHRQPHPGSGRKATAARLKIEREVIAAHEKHSGELLSYALSVARNREEARDAVQEVFLRFFLERTCGRTILNLRAWLYQVLRNHLLERLKSASSAREVHADHLDSIPDHQQDPEKDLQRRQLAREIAATLTDREFDCLRLRAEGFCYEDIANVLGVRSGTVGAVLNRVHRKLKPTGRRLRARTGVADAVRFLLRVSST
jgi:RNA polymerase sigma-70 factor, ECF subfamily